MSKNEDRLRVLAPPEEQDIWQCANCHRQATMKVATCGTCGGYFRCKLVGRATVDHPPPPAGEAIRAGEAVDLDKLKQRLSNGVAAFEHYAVRDLIAEVERLRAASDAPERDTRPDARLTEAIWRDGYETHAGGARDIKQAWALRGPLFTKHIPLASPRASAATIDWYDVCDKAWTALDETALAEPDASLPLAVLKLRERAEKAEAKLAALSSPSPALQEQPICWCGHHQSEHPFGHSENLSLDGRCRFCSCQKFAALSSQSPAPPPDKERRDKCRCPATHHLATCQRHQPGIPSQCGAASLTQGRCLFDYNHEGRHSWAVSAPSAEREP